MEEVNNILLLTQSEGREFIFSTKDFCIVTLLFENLNTKVS